MYNNFIYILKLVLGECSIGVAVAAVAKCDPSDATVFSEACGTNI